MKITVVVPTHNRSTLLARTITSLAEQDLQPTDIVVVDNCCTGDTAAVISRLAKRVHRLRRVSEPKLGVSHARNCGTAAAEGELVAFIDDDAVASRGWLEALATAADSAPAAVALAGPIGLRWPCAAPNWVRGLERSYDNYDLGTQPRTIEYPLYPFGSNVALRREALLSLGGFPTELGPRVPARRHPRLVRQVRAPRARVPLGAPRSAHSALPPEAGVRPGAIRRTRGRVVLARLDAT